VRSWSIAFISIVNLACGPELTGESSSESAVRTGTVEGDAVLALVNDPDTDVARLDEVLDRRAAVNIVAARPFATIEELDAVPYVGAAALDALLDLARAAGYLMQNGPLSEAERARVILAVVNDEAVNESVLDVDVGLDVRAARAIVAGRPIADLAELDGLPYVGEEALARILQFGLANGYQPGMLDVVFSPQAYRSSHNARVAQTIDAAQSTIDVAMYSFSDESIFDALERAVQRGVTVRFIYDTASEDRTLAGQELESSSSARLERAGIDVRWVNKIMHHKLALIDRTTLITGSGNWSYGAATRYDENTLFIEGEGELLDRFQNEFDLLWNHSRDFAYRSFPFQTATPIPDVRDDHDVGVYFTTANFTPSGDTFRTRSGSEAVTDQLVAAIEGATESVAIASGHMRLTRVSDALIAAKQANPDLDVRIYLDGQELVSASLGDELRAAGISVRYKYYAYRWHYSYAVQMHHKYMIIDGDELWTGSFNLSPNAETNTIENMIVLRGGRFSDVVGGYVANFDAIWETARGTSRYGDLLEEIRTASSIPLVFPSMSLTWEEVSVIRDAIRSNCSVIDSDPYRTAPEDHRTCPR
jgi:phosphatidylserine/phosphatidylglycerophosphate/cardiolipin synthase-like enzyme